MRACCSGGRYHTSLTAPVAESERALQTAFTTLRKATRIAPQKSQVMMVYLQMVSAGEVQPCRELQALLVKKPSKSESGVLVCNSRRAPAAAASALPLLCCCRSPAEAAPGDHGAD